MTWLTDILSNTPPKYRFILESSLGNVELRHPPLEWASGVLEFNRSLSSGGVISVFNVDKLTFVKEGAKLINDLFDQFEANAECTLRIYYLNEDYDYVEFPTSYSLVFVDWGKAKIGRNAIGTTITAQKNNSLIKFSNRIAIPVDVTKLVSIGGFNIVDWATNQKKVQIPEINSYYTAVWSWSGSYNFTQTGGVARYIHPANIISRSDFEEAVSIPLPILDTTRDYLNGIFVNSNENRTVVLTGTISIDLAFIRNNVDPDLDTRLALWVDVVNNASGLIDSNLIFSISEESNKSYNFSINETLTVASTQSIIVYFLFIPDDANGDVDFTITSSDLTLKEASIQTPATTVEGLTIYKVFERISQHYLDTQFAFYSDFLGTVDDIYNLTGDKYLTENQLRFFSILSGLNLRGELLDDINSPLSIDFKKMFHAAASWLNLGYGFETIDGFLRVRIEEYSYFFKDTEILDLSDRIGLYDIESEYLPELAFADIKAGFENAEYEEINGRGEYNVKAQRTSIINTDVILNNVSKVRGDPKGISTEIANSVDENGTTDSKADNKIFVIKTQRNTTDPDIDYNAETDENITIEDGTSLFEEGSLNLYITPTRSLIRWGNRLKVSLTKFLSSKIRFQTADKNQTLKTTGEGYTITENEDILVNDLDDPIYRPIKHTVEVKLDWDDIAAIQANPYGYIRLTSSLTGYLLNLKKKNNEDKAQIEIIEKI